jgi:hypothetical protein
MDAVSESSLTKGICAALTTSMVSLSTAIAPLDFSGEERDVNA